MGSTPILTWGCSRGFKTVITINANDVVTYARNFFFMTPVSPRSLTLVSFSVLRACSNLVLRSMISWSASSSICLLISSCSNPCSLCDSCSWELTTFVRLSLQIRGGWLNKYSLKRNKEKLKKLIEREMTGYSQSSQYLKYNILIKVKCLLNTV